VQLRTVADNLWGQAEFYTIAESGDDLITLDRESRPMEAEIEHSDSIIFVATKASRPAGPGTWVAPRGCGRS
jgi:hypothetical protein